jgi:hypothetical protein
MKFIFDSFLYKISNLLQQNTPNFKETSLLEVESDLDLHTHLSYADYVRLLKREEEIDSISL